MKVFNHYVDYLCKAIYTINHALSQSSWTRR